MLNVTGDLTKKNVLIENMLRMNKKIEFREKCNFLLDNVINLNRSIHSELRYIQNLWTLDIIDKVKNQDMNEIIIDRFYEEPYDTVQRILPKIVDLINNQFPKKASIGDKIKRTNIFICLEELGFANKTKDLKIEIR